MSFKYEYCSFISKEHILCDTIVFDLVVTTIKWKVKEIEQTHFYSSFYKKILGVF